MATVQGKTTAGERSKGIQQGVYVLSVVCFGDIPSFTQAVFHEHLPPLYRKWRYYSIIVNGEKSMGR